MRGTDAIRVEMVSNNGHDAHVAFFPKSGHCHDLSDIFYKRNYNVESGRLYGRCRFQC